MKRYSIVTIIFSFLGIYCSSPQEIQQIPVHGANIKLSRNVIAVTDWVDSTLQTMTVEEKVGQLFIVFTTTRYMSDDSKKWQSLERYVKEKNVGGFYFSIGGVYEFPIYGNKLQAVSKIPLLISVDFEYGSGMRIEEGTTFPRAMAVGATRDTNLSYRMGQAIAREARALGVHQNYSPVVDVNNNPKNPVINTRSFGEDPVLVSAMARAMIRGEQDRNLIATVKHFPGHGDTEIDTHLGLPSVHLSRKRMDSVELFPFKDAIKNGVMSVMVSHVHAAAFDASDSIPATASKNITTRLLKEEFGFKGIIVTDALAMKGVTNLYGPGEAAVRVFTAGSDMLLMSPDTDEAIDSIVTAVKRGDISMERLDYSVRKILQHKKWVGLDKNRFVPVEKVSHEVNVREIKDLAKEIARKSITVLGNKSGALPLQNLNGKKILHIVIADTEDYESNRELHRELRSRTPMELAIIDPRSNKMEFDETLKKVKDADLVICQFNFHIRSGAMTGFLSKEIVALMKGIDAMKKQTIGISMGNPYIIMDLPQFSAFVQTYGASGASKEACAEVMFGEQPARGKLPITIPGMYTFGDGVDYNATHVRSGAPEEAGFNADSLQKLDFIVGKAIADSAFPGAVLLVAKDGIIVHEKAYGRFTYDPTASEMTTESIFDLASVTKVIATTSAMMKLVEEGKVKLDDPVVKYFPSFGQNGKEKITIYNLLVHNSGLQAWRKYYEFCDSPQCVLDSIFAAPLIFASGDSTVYSDLGLITIGKIIEKVSKTTLDKYVDSLFYKPLGMTTTMYNPPPSLWKRVVPTEVDSFWKKTYVAVRGRVHDENAATLGGVSGHAGLFSTASDLVKILQMELNGGTYGGKRYLKEETIQQFIAQQSENSSRAIGWDTRSKGRSFSGQYSSATTFLHTGFTGTSVVVDPVRNIIVIFLTNRVYPTRNSSKLYRVRPEAHDAIYESLKK